MLEHMKKHLIEKVKTYPKITFIFGTEKQEFKNVSQVKINQALEILQGSESNPVSALDLIEQGIKSKKGIKSYRESAFHVKSLRRRDKLSQLELSKKTGIAQSAISSIENAQRPVGKKLAMIFSKIFNVNYKVFLSDLP